MSILRKQVQAHNIPQMQCGLMQMLPLCGFSRKPLEKIVIQEVDQNSKVKNQQISFPTLICEREDLRQESKQREPWYQSENYSEHSRSKMISVAMPPTLLWLVPVQQHLYPSPVD